MNYKIVSLFFIIFIFKNTQVNSINYDHSENLDSIESKMIEKMNDLKKIRSINLLGNIISLETTDNNSDYIESNFRNYEDPLITSVTNFFDTKKIQIKLPSDGSILDLFGRALGKKSFEIQLKGLNQDQSEARTKIKKMLLPILLALKLKTIIVLPIIITLIGLVGITGLGTGLAALLLSGAVALRALLTPPSPSYPSRISYGVVRPSEIFHEHWHRSQEEVNDPYKGWNSEYPVDGFNQYNLP